MSRDIGKILKQLPSMDIMLGREKIHFFIEHLGRNTVKAVLNDVISRKRTAVIGGQDSSLSTEQIEEEACNILEKKRMPGLRKVINATGVVIHTNLGRSCLSKEARESVSLISSSYNTLEYDLDLGKRGQRNSHVEWLLCEVTGAEAALVVNNNAGAVMLCLAALARGKEVIVSRGELVEIGGSFRVPEIMEFSGAKLVETGATNRTHRYDYECSVTENTAMLLKVHPSNFRIQGFTSEVSREELAELAGKNGLIFMEDIGSGVLVDVRKLGLSGEPTVRDCVEAGADVVTFSGDKMLGGPQIGGIVGRKQIIDRLRTFPLLRALRVDKMTLTAFETTLRQYIRRDYDKIPTLSMLSRSIPAMKKHASSLARKIRRSVPEIDIKIIDVEDAVGGGAFPVTSLSGVGIALRCSRWNSAGELQNILRSADPPVIVGAKDNVAVIHVRTLLDGDDSLIVNSLKVLYEKDEI